MDNSNSTNLAPPNSTDYAFAVNKTKQSPARGGSGSDKGGGLTIDEYKRTIYFQNCQDSIFNAPPPAFSGRYCNRTKGYFGCWPDTPAGQIATISCPDYVSEFHPDALVTRLCMSNGTWALFRRSHYKPCIDTEGTYRALFTYYTGYSLSIVACFIALIIFAAFRSLHCPRVTIHQNLFMTYIATGVFWITFYTLQGSSPSPGTFSANACKTVHVLATYFTVCSYCWMFCEGLYLYMNLVFAFINAKKVLIACIIIGWTAPVPFVLAYAVGMMLEPLPGECWQNPSAAIWFTQGVACVTLILNLFFVSHIVYILITKMRDVQASEQQQIRKVAKAILVLVPLLGLQYLLTPIAPDANHRFYSLYIIISATIASTQGLFVAVVFCFANGDVIKTILRKMRSHKYMSRLVPKRKNSLDSFNTTRYSTVRQQSAPGSRQNENASGVQKSENSAGGSVYTNKARLSASDSRNPEISKVNGDAEVTETLLDSSAGCAAVNSN